MNGRRLRTWVAVATVAALVAAAGCSSKSGDSSAKTGAPDKITYITSFGNFGRDAYVWVAKDKGYFKAANLDVTIEPGTGTTNVQNVATDKAQFTAVDFAGAILQFDKARDSGATLPIQAVAAIQQNSMAAVMAVSGSGITRPADLAGKKIADTPGSVVKLLFPAYAQRAGFDASHIQWVTSSPQQLPQLLATGGVNAVDQFVVGVPSVQHVLQQKDKTKTVTVLPFSDYIGDLYGNALWTSKKEIQQHPDVVRRFRDALLKGLQDALADPDGAGRILAKNVPTANAEAAAGELKLMKGYVGVGTKTTPLGGISETRVAKMVAVLQSVGAISHPIDPKTLVDFDFVPGGNAS